MGRDIGPKDKQSRRIGTNLFLKGQRDLSGKNAIVKRNYPPGVHGSKGFGRKMTEYGRQLVAKQKIKKMYRLREKQFGNYYKKASTMKGDATANFLAILENRFDNVAYKLGLADSRDQARQLVNHGHFLINGKKVNIPSYQMNIKDIITIKEKSKESPLFKTLLKEIGKKDMPQWLAFDEKKGEGVVLDKPEVDSLNLREDATLTIEFYSR